MNNLILQAAKQDNLHELKAVLRSEVIDTLGPDQTTTTLKEHLLARDEEGMNALDWAVLQKNHEAAALLLSHGADPNATPEPQFGEAPLISAILNEDIAMCQILIDQGADINQPDHYAYRPISRAVLLQQDPIVQLLIERGVELHFPTGNREDLIESAFTFGTSNIALRILQSGALHNPSINVLSHYLKTAIKHNMLDCVKHLEKAGANLHEFPGGQTSPLVESHKAGHLSISLYLVERGVDPHFLPPCLQSFDWIENAGSEESRRWRESLNQQKQLNQDTPKLGQALSNRLRF